jgi:hypothetical protein
MPYAVTGLDANPKDFANCFADFLDQNDNMNSPLLFPVYLIFCLLWLLAGASQENPLDPAANAFLWSPKVFVKEAILSHCAPLLPPNSDFYIPIIEISLTVPIQPNLEPMDTFEDCAMEIATRFFSTKLVEFYMLWTNLQDDVNNRLRNIREKQYFPLQRHLEGSIIGFVKKMNVLAHYANDERVETICEVGFNVGHSAALMAIHNPKATFLEFDVFYHNYSALALSSLQDVFFPDRDFLGIAGDSTISVSRFARMFPERKCNLIMIDGGHTREILRQDINSFSQLANRSYHRVFVDDSTMGDLFDEYSSFLVGAAEETLDKKMVFELDSWSETAERHTVDDEGGISQESAPDNLTQRVFRVPLRHIQHHSAFSANDSNCFSWTIYRDANPLLSFGNFSQLKCENVVPDAEFYEGPSVISVAEYVF